ncbi:MAG: hypothetical protein KF833_03880 [Verrucomicrobiae bacterium]|nr:hypothetical protein [Verrucomicrobiae bacterium]
MNPRPADSQSSGGFSTQDIYYVLFRHKGKILLLTLLGLIAAAGVYFTARPTYVSEARLHIRFVTENRNITPDGSGTVRTPDPRGDNIINSELEMLTSFNLVREVVESVGATNIVRNPEDPDPVTSAYRAVIRGIEVSVPRRSNVLRIAFRHSDPLVAQTVLTNLVGSYLRMHVRVHRSFDALNDVARQVDQRRFQLEQTERELRELKNSINVVDLRETKRFFNDQIGRIEGEIVNAQIQLEERRVALGFLTNRLAAASTSADASAPASTASPARLSEYRDVLANVQRLTLQEQDQATRFTEQSPFLRATRDLLAEAVRKREALETAHPELALMAAPSPSGRGGPSELTIDPTAAIAAVRGLEVRLTTLTNHLAQLQAQARQVNDREDEISRLERKLEIDAKQYVDYSTALERARVEEELSQGRSSTPNIARTQDPTPSAADYGNWKAIAAGLAGGGLVLGLALAFLLEFQLDNTLRRPVHVERNLRLPLFLSIPRLRLNGTARKALPAPPPAPSSPDAPAEPAQDRYTAPGEIDSYAEALRDRLMMHFQLHGLNHKPKLVGVTSCGHGAGVTTLATNLASSLSETGDGNVLYVDVNPDRGPSVQPFKHGHRLAGIRDALEQETREVAKVQENLYMVSLADPASGKVGIVPKTLSGLVPRMKASDYDYIIFDLPPITQTSATAKVAGLLDMTFVVVESEKTQSELAKKAVALLSESRANVAAVLNKHRRYLPRKVDTDL